MVTSNVAIVGCGLIGQKRAAALGNARLVLACDVSRQRACGLAARYSDVSVTTDWREAAERDDVDIVIVATTHDNLASVALEAARNGKHVLIEKPGARRAAELDEVRAAAVGSGALVRVGYNHRYHRAVQKAKEVVATGVLGELMFVRARYGHGGRPGYDREWRAEPARSGGGELLDQGSHLIDLARWFLGDFARVQGRVATYFWDMPVEDNAFLLLETDGGQVAFLHASWTEWKNTFSFELSGRTGKVEITGLGGSYGVERIALYRMTPEMGPPETSIWEYPMADNSWTAEFAEFLADIAAERTPTPGIEDAQAVLSAIEKIYQQNKA